MSAVPQHYVWMAGGMTPVGASSLDMTRFLLPPVYLSIFRRA